MEYKKTNTCRLCGMETESKFILKVLFKYDITYYKCNTCYSLQTEEPYWLQESYENHNLANSDTGAGQRILKNLAASYIIIKLLKLKYTIDIGGGDGLLCRLLRDYGVNCYYSDKYSKASYAQNYNRNDLKNAHLLMAFEVFEHFPNPSIEIDAIFRHQPSALLISTEVYKNQNSDWWYVSPNTGQHVFFYSLKALTDIAEKYNYYIIAKGGYVLFLKKGCFNKSKRLLCNIILNKYIRHLVRVSLLFIPTNGVVYDHNNQIEVLPK